MEDALASEPINQSVNPQLLSSIILVLYIQDTSIIHYLFLFKALERFLITPIFSVTKSFVTVTCPLDLTGSYGQLKYKIVSE